MQIEKIGALFARCYLDGNIVLDSGLSNVKMAVLALSYLNCAVWVIEER